MSHYTYELTAYNNIKRSDGAFIPNDPANRDYAEYQSWVAAGNTPTPYTPPPPAPALTSDQKLAALGLTLDDLAQLVTEVNAPRAETK